MSATPAEKKSRLLEIAGSVPAALVQAHLQRLDHDYWNEFSAEEILGHLKALAGMSAATPYSVSLEAWDAGVFGLTLLGQDFTGFFAAASGFLAGAGYDIRAGKAFTFAAHPAWPALPRGGMIDFFVLQRAADGDDAERARLVAEMENLFRRFESGDAASIRVDLFRRIGERLAAHNPLAEEAMPLEIHYHALSSGTQVVIRGPDREIMLFCIASALALRGLSLVKLIAAPAASGFFEDRVTVVGPGGQPLREARELEKIRAGIALMQRLLATLPQAANLQAAAEGLQGLMDDWLEESVALTEDGGPEALPALSRVLTAGPRMWEAVHALGPRAFRAVLAALGTHATATTRAEHHRRLEALRSSSPNIETFFAACRDYREREVLQAELDLLLTPARDFDDFAARLQALAEALLEGVLATLRVEAERRCGAPGAHALFALGKFGGEELGTGSDLEILWMYAGPGRTAGPEPVERAEFFERLARELMQALTAPSGATLALDWRLRPHGESGPLAVSFPAWKKYWDGAGVLEYERQALIRLRPVYGDPELIRAVLAVRDRVTYADPPRPVAETLELHRRQVQSKSKAGFWNAKYSPGGMVELEYAVQFLQLAQGRNPAVRQNRLDRALEALLETGVLTLAEFEHLVGAHLFLRRLINALRLVRGRSEDLHCPPPATPEFAFLAKRLSYVSRPAITAEAQLERDLNQARRAVSAFFRHRFGDGEKPAWMYTSIAEALMDPEAEPEEAASALERLGMSRVPQARDLFLDFFQRLSEKRLAAACLLVHESEFRRSPDPGGMLRKLTQFLQSLEQPDLFVRQSLHYPPLFEMLLRLFADSDALSDLVLRAGEGFKLLAQIEALEPPRFEADFRRSAAQACSGRGDAAEALGRLRNREYLRIALRDLYLQVHVQKITFELSALSDALMAEAWRQIASAQTADRLCLVALGKLGGRELNYSSDVDLVFLGGEASRSEGEQAEDEAAARALIELLTRSTAEGRLFRVDMNLRPWGAAGPLIASAPGLRAYCEHEAGGWELQAWLKARPVAGNLALGHRLIGAVQAMACAPAQRQRVIASMRQVRLQGLDKLQRENLLTGEVKLGPGGIRTVEFYTQSLQIRHGADIPELITGNTLEALGRLYRYGLVPEHRFHLLSDAYVFLRRVEHLLQLQGLRQVHTLPAEAEALNRLAGQMGCEDRIGQSARAAFLEQYRKHMLSLQPLSAELFGY